MLFECLPPLTLREVGGSLNKLDGLLASATGGGGGGGVGGGG